MTPTTAAAVGLRLIGLWILLESIFTLGALIVVHRDLMTGVPGAHSAFYEGNPIINAGSDLHLHDTYFIVPHFWLTVAAPLLRLLVGLVLLIFSKPLARVIARGLDSL